MSTITGLDVNESKQIRKEYRTMEMKRGEETDPVANVQGPQKNRSRGGNGDGDISVESIPLMKKKRVVIPLLILLLAGAAAVWYWYVDLREFTSTDDAYIDADRVSISSKMLGRITQLTVDEGDSVKSGQLLVRLDDSDIRAQIEQAQASLVYAKQNVTLTKVNLDKAQDDFQRAQIQFDGKIIPKEQFDHQQKALEAAQAQYAIALAQVGTAKAQLGVVETLEQNTSIVAPVKGVVSKRWVLAGDIVQPGQPIFSVYSSQRIWVTANFEETKLATIRLGDSVEIAVDAFPDEFFGGKVIQLGSNTASEFSLIPPNNASGNFTKVTQRVPVKISIGELHTTDHSVSSVLLPGMSVEVKVKVR